MTFRTTCRLGTLFFFIFCYCTAFSQKKFTATIQLAPGLDADYISYWYDDGITKVFLNDSFVNNQLRLKIKSFAKRVAVGISYEDNHNNFFSSVFFLRKKKVFISISSDLDSSGGKLNTEKLINATPVYDTGANEQYRRLAIYRQKEAQAVEDLWQQHGNEINRNDSFAKLNRILMKDLNDRILSFLRQYPGDYFSFWYFRDQIVESSLANLYKDTAYLEGLLTYMFENFPGKFTKSKEGQALAEKLKRRISAPLLNQVAPAFKIRDQYGNFVRLKDYKGKYVLLDFWASWCLPCRVNNPELARMRAKYTQNDLVMISISIDDTKDYWLAAIAKDKMDWLNVSDLKGWNGRVMRDYNILSVPTYILIDPDGNIILNSVNELPKLSATLDKILN